jgi:TRAP-type C4-dicarboxylate transport system substrate-binding protein
MNLNRFNGLSAEHRKALLDSALEAARFQRDLNAKQEGENLAKIKAAGVQVNEKADSLAFRKAAYDAVTKTYTDAHGLDIVNRILATK